VALSEVDKMTEWMGVAPILSEHSINDGVADKVHPDWLDFPQNP
jgi:hypothetical protein